MPEDPAILLKRRLMSKAHSVRGWGLKFTPPGFVDKADHGCNQVNPSDGMGGWGWVDFRALLSSLSSQTDELQFDLRETLSQKLRWLKKIPDSDFWAPHVHTCSGEHNHIFMRIPTPLTSHTYMYVYTHNTQAYTCNTQHTHKHKTMQRQTQRCTYNIHRQIDRQMCTHTHTPHS